MDFFSFQEQMKKPQQPDAAKKLPRQILTVSQLTSQIDRAIGTCADASVASFRTGSRPRGRVAPFSQSAVAT